MATQNIVFLVIFIIFLAFLFISSFVAKNWVKETDDYVLAGRQISTGMNIFGVIAIGFAGTTMALAPGFAIQFGFWLTESSDIAVYHAQDLDQNESLPQHKPQYQG